jgi:hypothetical protein
LWTDHRRKNEAGEPAIICCGRGVNLKNVKSRPAMYSKRIVGSK